MTTARAGRRSWWLGGAGVVAFAIVLAVVGRPDGRGDGPPLSPDSVGPSGTRALVLLLERLGNDVQVSSTVPRSDHAPASGVVVVLVDRLDAGERSELRAHVRAGGTLVVTDPSSSLSPEVVTLDAGTLERGECDITSIADSSSIAVASVAPTGPPALFSARRGASCFGDGAEAFVTEEALGAGVVRSAGSPSFVTNELIGTDDNAVLAVELLGAVTGTAVITIVDPAAPGRGEESLVDLIAPRVGESIVQLCVAAVLWVLYRARRVGRPVDDHPPVTVPASALVAAVAGLRRRAGGSVGNDASDGEPT